MFVRKTKYEQLEKDYKKLENKYSKTLRVLKKALEVTVDLSKPHTVSRASVSTKVLKLKEDIEEIRQMK